MDAREHFEPPLKQIYAEAETLRVCSGFRLKMAVALDQIAQSHGWHNFQQCIECKHERGAE